MRVLYIVGLGRSGSTLVDILLDSHSRISSAGGVRRLAKYARKRPCPCGAPTFDDCAFWCAVDEGVRQRVGCSLPEIDVHSRDPEVFRSHNRAVFESVAAVAGVDTVVDNSKSVGRLRELMKHSDLEIVPIHVMRDPRGRARSLRKRGSLGLIPTVTYTHRSLRIFALLRKRRHVTVDYDRLAADPRGELEGLMQRLGLDFEEQQLSWAEQSHHNIGAADVLASTDGSRIRPDNAHSGAMPWPVRVLVDAIALPGRIANAIKEKR